jgi:hypothetical protein
MIPATSGLKPPLRRSSACATRAPSQNARHRWEPAGTRSDGDESDRARRSGPTIPFRSDRQSDRNSRHFDFRASGPGRTTWTA